MADVSGNPPEADRMEIVHRDMKPGNIFLHQQNRTDDGGDLIYPEYPEPMLGDWGLAVLTDENDALNPRSYQEAGTPGFFAPEQLEWVDFNTVRRVDERRLGEKVSTLRKRRYQLTEASANFDPRW
jgi:hypothetical protein